MVGAAKRVGHGNTCGKGVMPIEFRFDDLDLRVEPPRKGGNGNLKHTQNCFSAMTYSEWCTGSDTCTGSCCPLP